MAITPTSITSNCWKKSWLRCSEEATKPIREPDVVIFAAQLYLPRLAFSCGASTPLRFSIRTPARGRKYKQFLKLLLASTAGLGEYRQPREWSSASHASRKCGSYRYSKWGPVREKFRK